MVRLGNRSGGPGEKESVDCVFRNGYRDDFCENARETLRLAKLMKPFDLTLSFSSLRTITSSSVPSSIWDIISSGFPKLNLLYERSISHLSNWIRFALSSGDSNLNLK